MSKAKTPRRVAIYCRISSSTDDLGVKRQERLCQDVVKRLGWQVEQTFIDNSISAYRRKRRPGYESMVAAIEAGRVNAIVCYSPDRLTRSTRDLEDLIDVLNAHDVSVETVRAGQFDLATANGRAQARMAGAFARLESEKMSERLVDKHRELVRLGKPNGGPRPFGYQREGVKTLEGDTRALVPHPTEAPIVAEIVQRVASGETLTRISESLNKRGITTSRGKTWTISSVRRVAMNPIYVGKRAHHGIEVETGTWSALVDEAVWRLAVGALTDPARGQRRSARRYLLTGGLLRCALCERPLYSKPHHDRRGRSIGTYVCRPKRQGGCGSVTVRAERVEALVTEWVFDRVESPTFTRGLTAARGARKGIAKDVRALEAQLDALAVSYGEGRVSEREWLRARDAIAKRLDQALAEMTADSTSIAIAPYLSKRGALRQAWPSLDLDVRQSILRSLVDHIDVSPVTGGAGPGFQSTRVADPVWRI